MFNVDRRHFLVGSIALSIGGLFPKGLMAAGNGKLTIAISQETGDLDLLQNVSSLSAYSVVFDALIHYAADGSLIPALAESWTEAADGKSISFKLREGVTFSDGEPFNAETAVWNLKRWMGQPDFSWIGISDAMKDITIDGSHAITIHLKQPVPAGLLELTIVRPVRFLSPKAVDGSGKQTAPVGTGPWIVKSYDNSKTMLVRNDNYWGEKPAFEELELKVVPDELARSNGLRSGDLDIVGGEWVAPLSPRRAKVMKKDGGVTVLSAPGTASILLAFSPKSKAVSEQAVREAICLGIERNAIVKILFEGFADATANVFPGNIPAGGAQRAVTPRNVDAAKAKLSGAGWGESGDGWSKGGTALEIELLVSEESLPGSRRLAEMIQGQLSEVGIKVSVSSVDNATIHDRRPTFEYDMTFMVTYGAPYDPHGTLANLFLSDVDSGPDGKIYAHTDLDPILRKALGAGGGEQVAEMQKIYDWLDANAAVCPLVAPQRLWAYNNRISTFTLSATDYDMPTQGVI